MRISELQANILRGTRILFMLAKSIDALPDSETRGELIYKHDKVFQRLADLQASIGKDVCYFGFTDKCPGLPCAECEYLIGESNGT